MKALDLFCGLGGWSNGLALEGFDILGVEIEPEIAELYKHDCIIADVQTLDPSRFKGFDLIVGSPPCRDFSIMANFGKDKWKIPPDPEGKGMNLVNAFLNFVEEAKPRYWLLENVPGLKKHLDIKPKIESNLGKTMKRCFWGNFPRFFIVRDYQIMRIKKDVKGKYREWQRAKIPIQISRALGKAIKEVDEE